LSKTKSAEKLCGAKMVPAAGWTNRPWNGFTIRADASTL
jgi:hypothetical protein